MPRRIRSWLTLVLPIAAVAFGFGIAAAVTAATHRSAAAGVPSRAAAALATPVRLANTPPAPASRHDAAAADVARVLRATPLVRAGSGRRRAIALSFDDGPGPYTRQIIRILAGAHVPATFFIVGQQLVDFGGDLGDELRHGFVVGDHTENHAWLTHLSVQGQYRQIDDAALRMRYLHAPPPRLFRPPYGAIDRTTLRLTKEMGMLTVLWSIDPGDWRRPGAAAITENVLSAARPGAIVLLHDGGGDRSQTVAALPAIIRGLRRRRLRLVTIPRLLTLDPPPRHVSIGSLPVEADAVQSSGTFQAVQRPRPRRSGKRLRGRR